MVRNLLTRCLLVALCATPLAAGTSTVHLRNGASLEGEVLRKKADRVVIDLGFTVIEVPMDEIELITEAGDESADQTRLDADSVRCEILDLTAVNVRPRVELPRTAGLQTGTVPYAE